jgi:hypothetical protein
MSTSKRASGTFEVKLLPQAADEGIPEPGRWGLDKVFRGDLEASSRGQMLAIRTGVENSAGYVAMERVTGALQGREGSFALQHSGTMNRGQASLSVTVVPDSGTGELVGLSGTMQILIEGGKHFYSFDYSFAEPA